MTWIIPTNSPISVSAQDMMASEKDLNSLATQLASTYSWRSKPSQVRSWSTRLKRVGWLQEFCTRMLKPSHTQTFTDALTSYLRASRASRLVQQDNAGQTMTHATSGHTSRKELDSADLPLFSSKMLMELSAHDLEGMTGKTQKERPFCSMSLENWKDWVTEQRQDALQRAKRAHHTNAKDGSSWPTPQAMEGEKITGLENQDSLTKRMRFDGHPDQDNHSTSGSHQGFVDAWRTPTSFDWKNTDYSTQVYLSDQVEGRTDKQSHQGFADSANQECADWPTPQATVGTSDLNWKATDGRDKPNKLGWAIAANWATPNTMDMLPVRSEEGLRKQATGARKGRANPANLREQVDPVANAVYRECADWPTARTSDAEGGPIQTEMTDDGFRSYRAKSGQWFGAKLRDAAETHEKQWATPQSRDNRSGGQERWENTKERSRNLNDQTAHTESKQNAKLNPRWVEALMGLEMGWVSPEPCTPTTCTNRTDELRLLGNGVVPQTCAIAIKTLEERLNERA